MREMPAARLSLFLYLEEALRHVLLFVSFIHPSVVGWCLVSPYRPGKHAVGLCTLNQVDP
jgi:hypothetical protein